jgi:hypothetical protein
VRGRRPARARIVAEQLGVQGAQLRAGFDAQLVDEGGPGLGVGGQRVGATAEVAVGDHPRRPQPLPQRLLGQGGLQLGERALGGARGEQRADVRLAQPAADLLQPGGRRGGPRPVGRRAVGPPAPERACFLGAAQRPRGRLVRQQLSGLGGQCGVAGGVDPVGRDDQSVPAGLTQQDGRRRPRRPLRFEHLAQPPDVRIQRGRGARAALPAPHGLGQRVRAHGLARVDEQQREGRLEPGPADRLRRARSLDLERSEVAESHPRHGGEDLRGTEGHNRDVPEEVVPRAVVLVEGVSDRAALVELARRRGDDLAADGVAVVAMGGATNVGHHVRRWAGRGVRLGGLCDLGEAAWFARALGHRPTPGAEHGVGVCVVDLEDELIRALGVAGVEEVIAREGELASLQTLRRQPAQRTRLPREHLHRFLGARSGNKERFARLLVGAVDLDRVPPVLHAVLDHALR